MYGSTPWQFVWTYFLNFVSLFGTFLQEHKKDKKDFYINVQSQIFFSFLPTGYALDPSVTGGASYSGDRWVFGMILEYPATFLQNWSDCHRGPRSQYKYHNFMQNWCYCHRGLRSAVHTQKTCKLNNYWFIWITVLTICNRGLQSHGERMRHDVSYVE